VIQISTLTNATESYKVELEKLKSELAGTRSEVAGLRDELVKEREERQKMERDLQPTNGRHVSAYALSNDATLQLKRADLSSFSFPSRPPILRLEPASDVLPGPDDEDTGAQPGDAPSILGLEQALEEVAKQKADLLEFKKGILTVLSQLVSRRPLFLSPLRASSFSSHFNRNPPTSPTRLEAVLRTRNPPPRTAAARLMDLEEDLSCAVCSLRGSESGK